MLPAARRCLLLVLALGGMSAGEAVSASATLIAQADALGLAADPVWLALLHVPAADSGASQVDDPAFFLAAEGRVDPGAELRADLAAFLEPPGSGSHAVDRFPARFAWLCHRLGLDPASLPVPACTAFEEAYARLAPRSAALVFPAAYMNTPASMFGHTLLVVRSGYRTGMLAQAINYAAVTGEDGGLAFAVKGVCGGYPGYYSLMPYAQKLQEYGAIDQRDIWEYELALDPADIRRLLLHVWEMRGIASDYWFFDENCSYGLLALLDASRPGLNLRQRAGAWVIPLDTVRVASSAGLVRAVEWRPSLATQVRCAAKQLPEADADCAAAVAEGDVGPAEAGLELPADRRAAILELAALVLQSRQGRGRIDLPDYQSRLIATLQARSNLGDQPAGAQPLRPARPDLGHASGRLLVGVGRDEALGYVDLGWRPAYHELADPEAGYDDGAQIAFCDLQLRWYEAEPRPRMKRLDAIALRSLTPLDRFYRAPSWRADIGLVDEAASNADDQHRLDAFGRLGVGLAAGGGSVTGYAFLDLEGRVSPADGLPAAGLGPTAGAVWRAAERLSVLPEAGWHQFVGQRDDPCWNASLKLRWSLDRDNAMLLEGVRSRTWGADVAELSLRWMRYF
jgi:hypothetical protein